MHTILFPCHRPRERAAERPARRRSWRSWSGLGRRFGRGRGGRGHHHRSGLATNSIILCLLFVKKINVLPGDGKLMTPCRVKTYVFRSSQQLPHPRLGPLKGSWSRHRALQGPLTCFQTTEKQGHREGVRCVALSVEVPGHRQEQLMKTLILG